MFVVGDIVATRTFYLSVDRSVTESTGVVCGVQGLGLDRGEDFSICASICKQSN